MRSLCRFQTPLPQICLREIRVGFGTNFAFECVYIETVVCQDTEDVKEGRAAMAMNDEPDAFYHARVWGRRVMPGLPIQLPIFAECPLAAVDLETSQDVI